MLGGGGLVAANVYATASETGSAAQPGQTRADQALASGAATIDCPDVGDRLTSVPDAARAEVDRELAALDQQIAEAYQRLQESTQALQQDAGFADSAIMNPLKEKRAATIERIALAVSRAGDRPQGVESLAECTLRASGNQDGDGAQDGQDGQDGQDQNGNGQDQGDGQQEGNGGQAGNGPVAADFVDITTVQPNVQEPPQENGASRGTFTTACGVNANGLFNSDNVIVAPGVTNGAHHFHDYVGNQANDAFASDEDLANGDTTCEDQGDRSSYFWPVLRLQNGTQEQDADAPGGGIEGNAGEIVTPKQAEMTFVGNPRGEVVEMPRLLRIITGDAKAFVNGPANANASWSCTGFEDRQLKDKYPVCPDGSDVVRTFKFQSCWDGRNIDSANHRTHVAFAEADGGCGNGFQAIPQLVQRIVYDVDAPSLEDGGRTTPLFAVDSFPEQLHKPVTDHGDFINVFDEDLMREMVTCINEGRECGAGADEAPQDDAPQEEAPQDDNPQNEAPENENPQDEAPQNEAPQDDPTRASEAPSGAVGNDDTGDDGTGNADDGDAAAGQEPKVFASATPTQQEAGVEQPSTTTADGNEQAAGAGTAPQTIADGGLADTGARLWPAAAGAVLLISGFLLLRSIRRGAL